MITTRKEILKSLDQTTLRITGQSAEDLRKQYLENIRKHFEKKHGRRMVFMSKFPFIGRGNVMRDRLIAHEEIEKMLEKALK